MSVFLICGGFAIIAVMRVVQRVCSKTSSLLVADNYTFFKYGAAYQLFAALFALVTALALVTAFAVGFYGVNAPTIVCSAISTILFGIDLFGVKIRSGTRYRSQRRKMYKKSKNRLKKRKTIGAEVVYTYLKRREPTIKPNRGRI